MKIPPLSATVCPPVYRNSARSLALAAVFSGLAALSHASVAVWANPGTGSWFTGSDWSTGLVPTSTDDARINAGFVFIGAGAATSNSVSLGAAPGSSGAMAIGGSPGEWVGSDFVVGREGEGSLTVFNGGQLSASASTIGLLAASEGSAIVDGIGSSWQSQFLTVAQTGNGGLTIQNGGTVTSNFAFIGNGPGTGTAVISGVGSRWNTGGITVGVSGQGSLSLRTGGTIRVGDGTGILQINPAGTVYLGDNSPMGILEAGSVKNDGVFNFNPSQDGNFALPFSGTGRILKSGPATVIYSGVTGPAFTGDSTFTGGIFQITGTIHDRGGYLEGGDVVVTGAGAQWINEERVHVGRFAFGRLHVSNGGSVTAPVVNVTIPVPDRNLVVEGEDSILTCVDFVFSGEVIVRDRGILIAKTFKRFTGGSPQGARMLVEGNGSELRADEIVVGSSLLIGGLTLFKVADGGTVTSITTSVGNSGSPTVVIDGSQSIWKNSGSFVIGGSSSPAFVSLQNGGRLVVGEGVGSITMASTATLAIGDGLVAGSLSAGSLANDGQIVFNFSGSADFSVPVSGSGKVLKKGSGTLFLDGNHTYSGETVVEAGELSLDGTLQSQTKIKSGASLSGDGSFNAPVTLESGAMLSPGATLGTIHFNQGLTLQGGTILNMDFGSVNDQIVVNGGIFLGSSEGGSITLNLFDRGGFGPGTYTLINFAGATPSDFQASDFVLGSIPFGTVSDYSLLFETSALKMIVAVPEPTSIGTLVAAGSLCGAYRRRRSARA